MRPSVVALAAALAVAAGLGTLGCSHKLSGTFLPNMRPVVRLTWAPIKPPDADSSHADFYIYKMNWTGYDPDGRVVSFQYAVDPPTAPHSDTAWVTTTKYEQIIQFPASRPDPVVSKNQTGPSLTRDFHVFVIRAVDNQGAPSEPVARAFFSFGVAPEVQIISPVPSELISPQVTPAFQITWTGKDYIDANGYLFEKPVKYKYKLFSFSKVPSGWVTDPDSMRAAVAPAFAGWDSCGGDTTSVQFTNQTPGSFYLFAIVAIGRSGAYSPIFSQKSNVMVLSVQLAGFHGPIIRMFNSYFDYTYKSGGIPVNMDPSWAIQLQVPAKVGVTFNWEAYPPPGSIVKRYRWVMDLTDLEDETGRKDQNDWAHWSAWSANVMSASIGPFTGVNPQDPALPELHNFYVEAEDVNNLRSLGWIQFLVVPFTPETQKPLLIVKDWRRDVDYHPRSFPPDSLGVPTGTFPTSAELDTFLFAVGGVRWRMTPANWPVFLGKSVPGIFSGYSYDTIGTRKHLEFPTQWISLDTLSQYSHIVWISSDIAAMEFNDVMSLTQPMTTLRYMSSPNRQNMLATWVQMGGLLWAVGGAFGQGTQNTGNVPVGWNNPGNDNLARTYSWVDNYKDLRPGRFMFDIAHWQSEFRVLPNIQFKVARLDQRDPNAGPVLPKGDWAGEPLRDSRFLGLPTKLSFKSPGTDPIWPNRTTASFYVGNPTYGSNGVDLEFMTQPNYITEGDPDAGTEYSTLDTLYLAYGAYPAMLKPDRGEGVNPCMTWYHGHDLPDTTGMVFTGFDIWHWQKSDCQKLVDVVLRDLWRLPKRGTMVAAQAPRAYSRPVAAPLQQQVQRPVSRPLGRAVSRPSGASWWKR